MMLEVNGVHNDLHRFQIIVFEVNDLFAIPVRSLASRFEESRIVCQQRSEDWRAQTKNIFVD